MLWERHRAAAPEGHRPLLAGARSDSWQYGAWCPLAVPSAGACLRQEVFSAPSLGLRDIIRIQWGFSGNFWSVDRQGKRSSSRDGETLGSDLSGVFAGGSWRALISRAGGCSSFCRAGKGWGGVKDAGASWKTLSH